MNRLPPEKRAEILGMMVEGNSIRAISRMTGASKNTIAKFLVDAGLAFAAYQDTTLRGLTCKRVQVDEIWSFIGAKEKNVPEDQKRLGRGDIWTWTAIDADTKLAVSWLVGGRGTEYATAFIQDLAGRVANRFQLTSDGHHAYLVAVENTFGGEIDYAQLVKIYGVPPDGGEKRYSPAECIGATPKTISGNPDLAHISTSYVERQNLTMRMGIRRFTRLTNAFSKKLENHCHSVAIHFMHYNFVRIHQTTRVTPAMAAGVTDKLFELEDLVRVVDEYERRRISAA